MKSIVFFVLSLATAMTFAADYNPYSYEISNKGNCKLMKYGQFTEVLVSQAFCYPIDGMPKGTDVRYEWSKKGNCKIMINQQFTQQFADDYYCSIIH